MPVRQPDAILRGSGKRRRGPGAESKQPAGSKTNSSLPRAPPACSAMQPRSPWLLLLVCVASSNPTDWRFAHPKTLYAWEGACVWIPCSYTIPKQNTWLGNFTLYHNPEYDNVTKSYRGTVLYHHTQTEELQVHQGRVKFLGDKQRNCTLSIRPVHVTDSGQLGFRMTSGTDKWMEEMSLNVSDQPLSPHIQPPPELRESRQVTLTCSLNFSCPEDPMELRWSLEGTVASSTILSTASVLTQSQLTFEPQWTHHGQNLTCRLWNSTAGRALSEKTVQLDVKHVPKLKIIEVSPSEATVLEGASVTMVCQVTSSNPDYQAISWLKDGAPLSAQTALTLTLPKVTKEMSGKYCCQASNELGPGKSEEVTLNVLYAPEPSRVQIRPLPAREGRLVELSCISRANPPPTNYTWFHNARELVGSTEEKLQIPSALLSHAGKYSCVAENSLGPGQIGPDAELDIQYPPKEVTTVIQNPTPIREGDSVTLSCIYNSSNPTVSHYDWKPLGPWEEPSPGVLNIHSVAWNAEPVACAACNTWCSWAPSVNLDVQYAPRGVKIWRSVQSEVPAGRRVTLRCNFSGSRPTEVRFSWKKNGSPLQAGQELSFDSITPEDAGNYSCSVNNSVGQRSSEPWTLRVLYAPRRLQVSMVPGDAVMEGSKVALTCESDANPPVSQYAWFDWNNQNLQHWDKTLKLEPTTVEHSGAYRCRGSNWLGMGESPPSTLTVYYSPETIGRRAAVGIGSCLALLVLAIWVVKLRQNWKRIRSQQGLQDNFSGQSFFVRNPKVRRAPLSNGPHSLGCYNPVMEHGISYATLRFPEMDTPSTGDAGTAEVQRLPLSSEDTVTYSVVQKRRVADYENVTPDLPEDEGIHYSELVQFGTGVRPQTQEEVEYVTLKQ
ncbi:B-cell receptor CD22 [Lepus europaeus]|uniref:B-cell receptor CD22 n=1 Tax=Lepus europaeus TaxID=9983 RepID=UPI002B4A3BD8|nr:B-cell receptor CD22 [Lepus europaeus]